MKRYISLLLSISLILLSFSACKKDISEETIQEDDGYHAIGDIRELDGGWYLFVEYDFNLKDNLRVDRTMTFDIANLKYTCLEDYTVTVLNEKDEVIGHTPEKVPYYTLDHKNNATEKFIEGTLLNREEKPNLSVSELSEVEDNEIFTKADLVDTYNTAMANGELTFGKYGNISQSDIIYENELSGYKWQVGYFSLYGNISAINIELIYSNNLYLSDIGKDELTNDQKELLDVINQIEDNIMKSQSFVNTGYSDKDVIGNVKISRLHSVLNEIEKGNNING